MIKDYKVRLSHLIPFYMLICLIIFLGVDLIFYTNLELRWMWGLIILINLFSGLKTPHSITYDESGKIFFKSLIFKKEYRVEDLELIKPSFGSGYYLNFRFNRRNVSVINFIDKIDELINDLKSKNKNIEIKGL